MPQPSPAFTKTTYRIITRHFVKAPVHTPANDNQPPEGPRYA